MKILLIILLCVMILPISEVLAESIDWEKKYKFLFKKLIQSRLQVAQLKGEIIDLRNQLSKSNSIEPVEILENKNTSILDVYSDYKKNPIVRDSDKLKEIIVIKNPILTNERLDGILEIDGSVKNPYDVYNSKKVYYDVLFEISRRGYVLESQTITTNLGGTFHFEVKDFDFPKYYNQLCYDLKYTVTYSDKTKIVTDDFLVLDSNTNYDFTVFDDVRWNYLPADFKIDPRQSYLKDEKCN